MFANNYQPKPGDTFKIYSCCGARGHLTIRLNEEVLTRVTVQNYNEKANLIRMLSLMSGLEVLSTDKCPFRREELRSFEQSENFVFREWETPESYEKWKWGDPLK